MKKRKYIRYELKNGHRIVYVGITNRPPEQRESEHRSEGKRFGNMRAVGSRVTKKSAQQWEENRLETYRNNHRGKNPRYNKTEK